MYMYNVYIYVVCVMRGMQQVVDDIHDIYSI